MLASAGARNGEYSSSQHFVPSRRFTGKPWRPTGLAGLLLLLAGFTAPEVPAGIVRHDYHVPGEDGILLFVREICQTDSKDAKPILLIHGARVPGIGSFDLPVPNGSLAEDLAQHGLAVYVMDVRGYGSSTRPPEMSQPPEKNPPLVRSDTAVRDIASVVEWIRKRTRQPKVALLGWATGGNWAGYYATVYSDRISRLILLNTLYGASDRHAMLGHGTDMESPEQPGKLNPAIGAYRFNTEASLFGVWDKSIPDGDKTTWRDLAVTKAYAKAALESDPTSDIRTPPSFRSPNGALEDSFYQAIGRKLWDASFIRVSTLIIAAERDFWSRPEDRELLRTELIHSPRAKLVVIPGATHFVHLDRPERGRKKLIEEIVSFIET